MKCFCKLASDEQKAVALRKASTHARCRHVFKSAGLIDADDYENMKAIARRVGWVIRRARKTARKEGRASDDKRSFVDSIAMAMAGTRNEDGSVTDGVSDSAVARMLNMPQRSASRALNRGRKKRKAVHAGVKIRAWSAVKKRSG